MHVMHPTMLLVVGQDHAKLARLSLILVADPIPTYSFNPPYYVFL